MHVFTVSSRVIKSSFICSFVSVLSSLTTGRKLLSSFIVARSNPSQTTTTRDNHIHVRIVYAYACKRSRKLNGLLYYIRVVCRHVCMYVCIRLRSDSPASLTDPQVLYGRLIHTYISFLGCHYSMGAI